MTWLDIATCEVIKCPFYIDKKCASAIDYVNKNTGEDMCHLNPDAIPREEYES